MSHFGDVGKPAHGELNGDGHISSGNLVGQVQSGSSQGAPHHRLRSNLTAWQYADFTASATLEYRSRVRESCTNFRNTAVALTEIDPQYADLINLCSDPNFTIDQYQFRPGTTEIVAAPTLTPINYLGGTTYTHVQAGWTVPWNAEFTLGVRNLFDKHPPLSSNAFANTFDAQYLIPGRFIYFNYKQSF
ncbi:TonB-dependent receptor [Luteimonas suaedae]|uniref:TonB-dependent receptor n=1 Tax=Luteimonas suaedae TaxID=2605430 RepID=UPI0016599E97|nr:TonB-dependent receptor [Luteimonas suaedae]